MRAKGHISQAILGFSLLPIIYNDILPYKLLNDKLYNFIFNSYFYPGDNISILINMILMLILTIIGAGLPDIDFKFKYLYPPSQRYIMLPRYHRQFTHSLSLNLFILFLSIYYNNVYIFFIWYGVIIHLIGDMLTGSIPVLLWGKYYIWPSRIGIDRFIPNSIKVSIHNKITNFCEKYWYVTIILAFIIYFFNINR